MLKMLNRGILLICALLSSWSCVAHNHDPRPKEVLDSTRFIIQLAATAQEQKDIESFRQQKLDEWEKSLGVSIVAISPPNNQQWIVRVKTLDVDLIKKVLKVIQSDQAVEFIEEDRVATTMPIMRALPAR